MYLYRDYFKAKCIYYLGTWALTPIGVNIDYTTTAQRINFSSLKRQYYYGKRPRP